MGPWVTYPRTLRAIQWGQKFFGKDSVAMTDPDTWFVSYPSPAGEGPSYRPGRIKRTFRTEAEAKEFARLVDVSGMMAGTINPHQPKQIITAELMTRWLRSNKP